MSLTTDQMITIVGGLFVAFSTILGGIITLYFRIKKDHKEDSKKFTDILVRVKAIEIVTKTASEDHDKVVGLSLLSEKMQGDINAQHGKIREVENNVSSFISTFRHKE